MAYGFDLHQNLRAPMGFSCLVTTSIAKRKAGNEKISMGKTYPGAEIFS